MNATPLPIRRRTFVLGAAAAAATPAWAQAPAAGFPSRPLRMVVGYAPGGAADTLGRLLGTKSQERFGQPMLVDNKPGAGGLLAAEVTAKSPPDGYTFFLSDDAQLAIAPGIGDSRALAMERQLVPVVGLTTIPMVLVVGANSPAGSMKDLIGMAKSRPGLLNYASAGNGNISHVAGELFKSLSKTFITHVPYRGGAPGLASVLAGETQMMFVSIPTALPHIKAERVKALGVANVRRSQALPDVPTCTEAGLPEMVAVSWHGVVAPAGTPAAVSKRLSDGFIEIMKSRDVTDRLRDAGYENTPREAPEFARWIASETDKWRMLARTASIKPDA